MTEDLHAAVLHRITDVVESEDFLTRIADAVVEAVTEAGYFPAAGVEYAVRRGDRILEAGFNTEAQAHAWATSHLGNIPYEVPHRPVGVWEPPGEPIPVIP